MRKGSTIGVEIEHLIDAITRDAPATAGGWTSPAAFDAPAAERRIGVRGSAAIAFAVPFAVLGSVAYVYLGSAPKPTPQAIAPPPPIPAANDDQATRPDPLPTPIATPERSHPPARKVAATRPEPVPAPRQTVAAPPAGEDASGKAVHLTGAALEAALAEDRIKTRQLNLGELRDGR